MRCERGATPLHVAAASGNIEAIHILLKNGADKKIKDNTGKMLFCNYYDVFILMRNLLLYLLLFQQGTTPNTTCQRQYKGTNLLV